MIRQAYLDALDPQKNTQLFPTHVIALIEKWNKTLTEQWKKETKEKNGSQRQAYPLCKQNKTGNKCEMECEIDENKIPVTLQSGDVTPLVAGISPIVDLQNMDVFEGARQTAEVAAQISAALKGAGYGAAGDFFARYARRLETDKQLRASLPTVSSYSTSGGGFGFLISPRMTIGKAYDGDAEQVMGLESQGFPVLVLIQIDKEDIGLRFKKDKNGVWEPVELHIRFDESTRWRRFKKYWWWYDINQSEEKTILLRSKVSELGTGMIGFDELRRKIKTLDKIHCIEESDNLICPKGVLSALKKLQ